MAARVLDGMKRAKKKERQDRILAELRLSAAIRIPELAESFGVSTETIRRDLEEMAEDGLIMRTYGGAVVSQLGVEPGWMERDNLMVAERERIGGLAEQFVRAREIVMIDAGSTTLHLARRLALADKELTVITNGINLALELKDIPGVTVILTGGIVTSASASIEGLLGADLLKKIHTDIAFVSARGFSVEDGLTDFSIYEADLKHMCIKASAKTVALVDHTKFDTTSISSYASLDDINMVITDSGISPETADIYEKAGTDIVISGI